MTTDGSKQPFVYDALHYPSPIINTLTPDRIAAAGLAFGWEGPDPTTASVLEIGCGDGLNLIAIAAAWPQCRCVGFDLSASQIEIGRATAAAAGLQNVELVQGDILTWPRKGEGFDYIVAHGVHTWVPDHVRDAMMELFAARLSPAGIGYISYDCLPAAAPKQAVIGFLHSRVAGITDIGSRIEAAQSLVGILHRSQSADSRLKVTLDGLLERMKDYDRAYFFHDWLSEFYSPSSLAGFARAADDAGLTVVGDAELTDLFVSDLDDDARNWLINEGRDAATHGALLDMMRGGQTFRRTLVSRTNALLPAVWDGIRRLRYVFMGTREDVERDGAPAVRYGTYGQAQVTTSRVAETRIMDLLHASGAEEMTFPEIVEASGIAEAEVDSIMRQMAAVGLVDIHCTPNPATLTPGERPRAGRLVRALFARSDWAINLRHLRISSSSDATRLLLVLCDGSRDRAELRQALADTLKTAVTQQEIDDGIESLAQQYCFEA